MSDSTAQQQAPTLAFFNDTAETYREGIRERSMHFPIWNPEFFDVDVEHMRTGVIIWYWKQSDTERKWSAYVEFEPGTLASSILSYEADLPADAYYRDVSIFGNIWRPAPKRQYSSVHLSISNLEDSETPVDLHDIKYSELPVVYPHLIKVFNPIISVLSSMEEFHNLYATSFHAEHTGLLSMPGALYVSRMIGKLADGRLVLTSTLSPQRSMFWHVLGQQFRDVHMVKDIFLQMIDAVDFLHACGVVGISLALESLHITEVGNLFISDLRGLIAQRNHLPPECYEGHPWTRKSDIFGLGMALFELCMANNSPRLARFMCLQVPPPFQDIFTACIQANAAERSSLHDLREMVKAISVI